jgi:hypothetical protein
MAHGRLRYGNGISGDRLFLTTMLVASLGAIAVFVQLLGDVGSQ